MTETSRKALDPNRIQASSGEHWRSVEAVAETGSTNADLLARAAAGTDIRGAVLLADYQSAGRGRHGRSWTAPRGSQIAMSVAIDVDGVNPDGWGWIPLLTGVAVAEAVRQVSDIQPTLKWPNDVQVDGGKLAGILAEVAAPDPVIVVGLGLNVSLTPDEAPTDTATSLTMLGLTGVDRDELAAAILRCLGDRVATWRAAGADAGLTGDYRRLSGTLGSRVRAELPGGQQIIGTATDIDPLGRLVIDDGTAPVIVAAGDITHLRNH